MKLTLTHTPEILSPAGDFERLKSAVTFGADAVYLAGKEFGMRASQTNFDNDTMQMAVEYAHAHGVRVYVTINTLPRNDEIDMLPKYLKFLDEVDVDAVIASDIGVLSLVNEHIPNMEVHVSTQAGVVNYQTCLALHKLGAKRIVLARELSLEEIADIRKRIPDDLELEVFVHGAMCMSFSGRCLISNYLTGRDANRGECAQPCRWGYHLVEEKRPNQFYPIFEDEKGSYILNAKDLCMLEHIDKLIKAGVTSLKIEGRAKSSYYVSVVTNAYKMALDEYSNSPESFVLPPWLYEEVQKVSHRQYSTGFYFGTPDQYYENGGYTREYDIVALVLSYQDGFLYCLQKNKFSTGEEVEILEPNNRFVSMTVGKLQNADGEFIETAPNAGMTVKIACEKAYKVGTIIRRKMN